MPTYYERQTNCGRKICRYYVTSMGTILGIHLAFLGLLVAQLVESACNGRVPRSIPGLGGDDPLEKG